MCVYVYICVYVRLCMCMYVYVRIHIHVRIHILCIYVYVYMYVYVCVCMCMYAYMHIHTYMVHIHIHTRVLIRPSSRHHKSLATAITSWEAGGKRGGEREWVVYWYCFSNHHRMCSLTTECVLFLESGLFIGTPSVTLALDAFTTASAL